MCTNLYLVSSSMKLFKKRKKCDIYIGNRRQINSKLYELSLIDVTFKHCKIMLSLLLHNFHFATDFPYLEVLMNTQEPMARVSFQQHS